MFQARSFKHCKACGGPVLYQVPADDNRDRATCTVCGHVHYRRRHQAGGTLFLASCLGYAHEWPDPADAAGEVHRSLTVLEI